MERFFFTNSHSSLQLLSHSFLKLLSHLTNMVTFSGLFLAACAFASAFALPAEVNVEKRALYTSQTGECNGYHYSFWTNGGGKVEYNNEKNGEYSVSWENCGDFTSGKGWSTGSAR